MLRNSLMFFLSLCLAIEVNAATEDAAPPAKKAISFQTGKVIVGDNLATIDLPEGYRFLNSTDARYVVEQVWGNPPSPDILGMVAPPDADPTNIDWATIVTYDDKDGHVKDDDQKKLNYDELLQQNQQQANDANEQRKQHGFPIVELVGWAEPPHYDADTHKLYFAERLRFGSEAKESLNYKVRILGRKGFLVLNAVADASQLAAVAEGSKAILSHTEFNSGNGYADFKPGYDKVAAYGIGGLIATGLLAKVGFFAVIGKLLLAFIKPIIIGLIFVGGAIAKIFSRKKSVKPQDMP